MLGPLDRNRTVDLAADTLRRQILGGAWPAGGRLPPERQLAETLGISRLTLRAALSRLEGEGLVRARQGAGIEVLDLERHADVAVLPHLVVHGTEDLLGPFLVLRRAIAAEAVALATERATDADLDRLGQLATELADVADRDALVAGNLAFAEAIVDLAGNLPIRLLFNTVAQVFDARPALREALVADTPAVRASFGLIVRLLRERDPARAREAVRVALEAIDARTLAALEAP